MPSTRVLVVEDEMAVALDIQSTLTEAGYDVVGPMLTLDEALQASRQGIFDAAILDANLNGQNVSAVAETLIERRVPFFVVSGYAREHLPLTLAHAPLLPKPFQPGKLLAMLQKLCHQPGTSDTSNTRNL